MRKLTLVLVVVVFLALVALASPMSLPTASPVEAKVLAPAFQVSEVAAVQDNSGSNHTIVALAENNRPPISGTYLANLITSPITEGHAFAVASASTAITNRSAYNVSMATTATFGQTMLAAAQFSNAYNNGGSTGVSANLDVNTVTMDGALAIDTQHTRQMNL